THLQPRVRGRVERDATSRPRASYWRRFRGEPAHACIVPRGTHGLVPWGTVSNTTMPRHRTTVSRPVVVTFRDERRNARLAPASGLQGCRLVVGRVAVGRGGSAGRAAEGEAVHHARAHLGLHLRIRAQELHRP